MNTTNISDTLTNEIISKVKHTIDKETDRGCVLVSSAFIDLILEKLLAEKMTFSSKNDKKDIFGVNGPLGNFSSKIKLAGALEIIDKRTVDNINIVRKIRNSYAHDFSEKSLDNYKEDIFRIKIYPIGQVKNPRQRFINSIISILASIHSASIHFPTFADIKANLYKWYKDDAVLDDEIKAAIQLIE